MKPHIIVALVALSLALPTFATAQCFTLQRDKNGSCTESDCQYSCALNAEHSRTALKVPGFTIQEQKGKLLVSSVVPNSPAQSAGIRVGDELLRVDDISTPFTGDSSIWTKTTQHTLQLSRGPDLFQATVVSAPVNEILAALPTERQLLEYAAFSSGRGRRDAEVGPFMSGMTVHRDGASFVVDTVLRRSPAYEANLRPGDRFEAYSSTSPKSLETATERVTLNIKLTTKDTIVTRTVRFASLSELLEAVSIH